MTRQRFNELNRLADSITPQDFDFAVPIIRECLSEIAKMDANGQGHLIHGTNCRKVLHGAAGGYLHGDDDDSPYDVDGMSYCGRCHLGL